MTMATNASPRYLLDTNICIYAMNRHMGVLRKLREHGRDALAISSLVLGELAYGVAKSERKDENTAALLRFQAGFNVLPWDESAMWHYGENFHRLKSMGTKIGEIDLLMGCQALSLDMIFVTNNTREFERIDGLKLENWVA
jgi:tRNA(fMet)-specific endonuclease VapC